MKGKCFVALTWLLWIGVGPLVTARIEPFDLADVKLGNDTIQAYASRLNIDYLFMLEPDRVLWTYRRNAGLPTPSEPFTDSWEAPQIEVRGQFMGHYLTALSYAYRTTGDERLRQRIDLLVTELRKVQEALGSGYLSAFPSSHFDRLQNLEYVWAPYYVIHKIMAGLLDAHGFADNQLALVMATDMAQYFFKRTTLTLAVNGTEHWRKMLQIEFGGMSEVLYRLYRITNDPNHLYMATLFEKPDWYQLLVNGIDDMAGRHANTHLAQVNGFAARYVAMGQHDAFKAVSFFFDALTTNHSYATGGSSENEGWGQPNELGQTILQDSESIETQETCSQYNTLKIARSLFTWTGEPRYADFYERALMNGILGAMRAPPRGGLFKLLLPLVRHRHSHPPEHAHLGTGNATGGKHHRVRQVLSALELGGAVPQHGERGSAAAAADGGEGEREAQRQRGGAAGHDHGSVADTGRHEHGRGGGGDPGHHRHESMGDDNQRHEGMGDDHQRHEGMGDDHQRHEGMGDDRHRHESMGDDHHNHNHRHSVFGRAHEHGHEATWDEELASVGGNWRTALHRRMALADDDPEHMNLKLRYRPRINLPGPGVYTYLTPLGSGHNRGETRHGWGFPFHSFWCCYGTSIESFAKLHDSIYFQDMQPREGPPRLYVNQYVTSTLTWRQMGVAADVRADMFAGAATSVNITIRTNSSSGTEFDMMFRVPSWAGVGAGHRVLALLVNGAPWHSCMPLQPGQFCNISRVWKGDDVVSALLPKKLYWQVLPDNVPGRNKLAALMMGPLVMAGLTHDSRLLELPSSDVDPGSIVWDLPKGPAPVSFKVAWHDNGFLRHHRHDMYATAVEDSGDALDGTFRVLDPETTLCGGLGGATRKLNARGPRMVMLEMLGLPGFFMGYSSFLELGVHMRDSADPDWCWRHRFVMQSPGLTGEQGTVSFQAADHQGLFVSAYKGGNATHSPGSLHSPCHDALPSCHDLALAGLCITNKEYMSNVCRKSCGTCTERMETMRMVQSPNPSEPAFALASTFFQTEALAELPQGTRLLKGMNRHYLVAPMAHIVDERYTVYFELSTNSTQSATNSSSAPVT